MSIHLHLFGLWDSRGGTMAVETNDMGLAMETVAATLGDTTSGLGRVLADSYLGEFDLDGPLPEYTPGGTELDADWDGAGYVFIATADIHDDERGWASAHQDWRPAPSATVRNLLFQGSDDTDMDDEHEEPVGPEGWVYVRWDDDAYSFYWLKANDQALREEATPVDD